MVKRVALQPSVPYYGISRLEASSIRSLCPVAPCVNSVISAPWTILEATLLVARKPLIRCDGTRKVHEE